MRFHTLVKSRVPFWESPKRPSLLIFYANTQKSYLSSRQRPTRPIKQVFLVSHKKTIWSSIRISELLVFDKKTFSISIRRPTSLLWQDFLVCIKSFRFLGFYEWGFNFSTRSPSGLLWEYLLVFLRKGLSVFYDTNFRFRLWEDFPVSNEKTFWSSMKTFSDPKLYRSFENRSSWKLTIVLFIIFFNCLF